MIIVKNFFFLIALSITQISFAQLIQGKLINAKTNLPIPQVTVFTDDASIFVTSNQKGEFLVDAQLTLNKTLYIDDYEYEFSEKTISSTQSFEWKLVPNSETLEEIVIYKRNIKEVLLEIIDHSIASFSKNTKIEAFYRENYLKRDRVETYAEGLMDFYIGKKLKNVSTIVNQSRIVDLYTNPADTIDMAVSITVKPSDLIESSMRFRNIKDFITSNNYEFLVKSKRVGDRKLHTCYITPTEKSTKRFLFSGYFVFDEEKKLILETNFEFAEDKKVFNKTINLIIAKLQLLDMEYKTKYLDTEKFYYPTYARVDYDAIVSSKLAKVKDERLNTYSYFYTLKFKDTEVLPTESKEYKATNLFSNGNKYTEEFWKDPVIQNLSE